MSEDLTDVPDPRASQCWRFRFNGRSPANYQVFLDGVSKGTGSFTWSGNNENYIGLDARDSGGVSLDNFSITIVPEPSATLLVLLGGAGLLVRRRKA